MDSKQQQETANKITPPTYISLKSPLAIFLKKLETNHVGIVSPQRVFLLRRRKEAEVVFVV